MPSLPAALREQLDAFINGPALVRQAIDGIDAGLLNRRPPGDDWSIRDVVLHLSDVELVGAVRIRLALAEESPPMPMYEQEAWKRRLQYLWRDPEAALGLFQQTRYATAEILEHCGVEAWQRTTIHPERGLLTVSDLVGTSVDHVTGHVAQIGNARAAFSSG
ncbi:MAG: DinB family protein [Tepidiformaceae bacterium]